MKTTSHFTATSVFGGILLASSVALAAPASAQDDENCFFSSQAGAQEAYRSLSLGQEYVGPRDEGGPITTPGQFDPDQDGVACEDYTGTWAPSDDDKNRRDEEPVALLKDNTVTTEKETVVMPEGGVATGAGGTAGPQNMELIITGAFALIAAFSGIFLVRRRLN